MMMMMMRKLLTFVLPVGLAACASGLMGSALAQAGAASAAKAERPDVKVGDRWKFACAEGRKKSDRLWVVTSVDLTGVKGTWNGQPLAMTLDLNEVDSPEHTNTDKRLLSFPLEVGKQWTSSNKFVDHTNKDVKGSEKYSVRVADYGKVRVPAGEFDTFKLKAKSSFTAEDGSAGTHEFTYWYAPAARAVVKGMDQVTWQGGGWPETTCELVEFQLQP